MINKFEIRKFVKFPIELLILSIISFSNYCIVQIFGTYFLPITIIPIFLAGIFRYQISIFLIAGIGLLDDLLSNGHLGLYPLIYLSSIYLLDFKLKDIENRKYLTLFCILLFLIINIFTFN